MSLKGKIVSIGLIGAIALAAGSGHDYWVDPESGFTQEDQEALIDYLLRVNE